MTIFVGSTNPVKVEAVKRAALWQWQDLVVVGYEVKSKVKDQPMTDNETRKGAENRAKAALKIGLKESQKPGEIYLGMGLEGGVFIDKHKHMWSTVWAALVDTQGNTYVANGARVKVPDTIAHKIKNGEEMGPVMEKLTGLTDVRKRQGMFGIITKEFVTRTEEYSNIAKIALGLWYGRDWDQPLKS